MLKRRRVLLQGEGRGASFFCIKREPGLSDWDELLDIEDEDFVRPAPVSIRTLSLDTPDYGSGPHMRLVTAAVILARRDLATPRLAGDARAFLDGSLVALFSDCVGYEGAF